MSTQQPWKSAQRPDEPQSVHEFVRRTIRTGPVVPLPWGESWSQMIERTRADHWTHEIDQEAFDSYLDRMPPKFQGRGWFAFAEGAEPIRLFVHDGRRFLCRQLSWSETDRFCALAQIGLPQ